VLTLSFLLLMGVFRSVLEIIRFSPNVNLFRVASVLIRILPR
jgi:hypothetical protein